MNRDINIELLFDSLKSDINSFEDFINDKEEVKAKDISVFLCDLKAKVLETEVDYYKDRCIKSDN